MEWEIFQTKINRDVNAITRMSKKGMEKYRKLKDKMEVFTIPETLDGKPVEMLAANCFNPILDGFDFKGRVVLPQSMMLIAQSAFTKSGVTEINIPSNVVEIGQFAFHSCKNLTKVTFEEGGEKRKNLIINLAAFYGCGLSELNLPERVLRIDRGGFGSNKITKLVLPKTGFKSLEEGVFANNPIESLENWIVEDGKIPERIFLKSKLKNVPFQFFVSANTSEEMVDEKTGIARVKVASGQKNISYSAFEGALLRSLEIPSEINLPNEEYNYYNYDFYGSGDPENSPFEGNKGWDDEDSSVALYVIDKNGEYVIDNYDEIENPNKNGCFLVNPVKLKLNVIDKDSKEVIYKDNSPKLVKIVRDRIKQSSSTTLEKVVNENYYDVLRFLKIGDRFQFELPELEGYEVEGVEVVKKDGGESKFIPLTEVKPRTTVLLSDASVKAMSSEEKHSGKVYELTLGKDNINIVSYGDGYEVGYRELELNIKYKKPAPPVVITELEPTPTPEPTPESTPSPQPPITPVVPTIVNNDSIILPIDSVVNPYEPLPAPEFEEISFDEDLTPRSDADLEEEGLEILGDDVPQGRKDFTNGKRNKDMKGLLAKTGGLHTVFYQLAAGLGLILLASILVELYRKRKPSK